MEPRRHRQVRGLRLPRLARRAQPLRAQPGLVRHDARPQRAYPAEDLLPLDPQLPLRPQLVTEVTMATRQLPTKPHGNTPIEPARRKGPTKGERAPTPKPIKGRRMLKPPVEAAVERATAKTAARTGAGDAGPPDFGDQQPARKRPKVPERYIRLRVRVDDGERSEERRV